MNNPQNPIRNPEIGPAQSSGPLATNPTVAGGEIRFQKQPASLEELRATLKGMSGVTIEQLQAVFNPEQK